MNFIIKSRKDAKIQDHLGIVFFKEWIDIVEVFGYEDYNTDRWITKWETVEKASKNDPLKQFKKQKGWYYSINYIAYPSTFNDNN